MAQQVTRPTKNKNPGKKRRAAIKAAHLAAKTIDDHHVEKSDIQEEMEERPPKRAKVSHVKGGDDPKPLQPAPVLVHKEEARKPEKVGSRKEDKLKETRDAEKVSNTNTSSKTKTKDTGDLDISQTHNVISINVISSSSINQKVSQILSHLSKFSFADVNAKPIMVEIGADAPVASKAISIVEITKSELDKQGAKWYQYSIIEPKIVQIPRKDERRGDEGGVTVAESGLAQRNTSAAGNGLQNTTVDGHFDPMDEDKEAEEEEDADGPAFEEMIMDTSHDAGDRNAVKEKKPKIRAIPRLVVYVSRVRSEKWKRLYG